MAISPKGSRVITVDGHIKKAILSESWNTWKAVPSQVRKHHYMSILVRDAHLSLTFTDVPSTFDPPQELVDCEDLWSEYVRLHNERGGEVWNSNLYRFERYEDNELFTSSIELKEVLLGRAISHCPPLLNMFVATIPITTEGQIVLCRPSRKTTTNATLSLIGGALSRDEGQVASTKDLTEWGERELLEEANLGCEMHPAWDYSDSSYLSWMHHGNAPERLFA